MDTSGWYTNDHEFTQLGREQLKQLCQDHHNHTYRVQFGAILRLGVPVGDLRRGLWLLVKEGFLVQQNSTAGLMDGSFHITKANRLAKA